MAFALGDAQRLTTANLMGERGTGLGVNKEIQGFLLGRAKINHLQARVSKML